VPRYKGDQRVQKSSDMVRVGGKLVHVTAKPSDLFIINICIIYILFIIIELY
jgi:hypothetical protein